MAQAREAYPPAKAKFLVGLPEGYHFSVVTQLHDKNGQSEQVFVVVVKIEDGIIDGWINNDITLVSGFRKKDRYRFPEAEIVDWVITGPDGSEEGNVIGKWLETHRGPY